MRIEIEIPKEFEEHFKQDKFKDSLKRIMVDIEHFQHSSKNGYWLCAGRYEYETIEMLQKAFEDSKSAYDVDKVVEELEKLADDSNDYMYETYFNGKEDGIREAIEIVKQGGIRNKVVK